MFECDLPFKGQWLLYVPSVLTFKILRSYIPCSRQPAVPPSQYAIKERKQQQQRRFVQLPLSSEIVQTTGTLLTTNRDLTRGGGARGAAGKGAEKQNFKLKKIISTQYLFIIERNGKKFHK